MDNFVRCPRCKRKFLKLEEGTPRIEIKCMKCKKKMTLLLDNKLANKIKSFTILD